MYALRKADLVCFPCDSRDVCRISEGSTNSFLAEPRVLEEFLKGIEPRYSKACSSCADGTPTFEAVATIAGFVAFVIGCSPTAMRLGSVPFERLVHAEAELLEEAGLLDPAPPELDGKLLSELLAEGVVKVDVDRKFPQAYGITTLIDTQQSFGSFPWELLVNKYSARLPFVTSDYPAAIEPSGDPRIVNRVVPLRPDLAVRIHPKLRPEGQPDLPEDFRFRIKYSRRSTGRSFDAQKA